MNDEDKTKEQLVDELAELRRRVVELTVSEAECNQAAIAIENARLYEAERRRSAELEALRQASLHLTSSLDLQSILEAILDHAFKLVAAHDVHVFLYHGEQLAFGAALWEDGRQKKAYAELRPQGLTYAVARSGERIVVPDVNSHPLFRDYQWDGAIIGLPLRIGERVVGVMTVALEKPHVFDEGELRVLGLLADQAAIAIENARLYEMAQQELAERKQAEETLKRRNRELATLYEAATTISSNLSLDIVLQTVAEHMTQALDSSGCALSLWNREQNWLETVVDYNKDYPDDTDPPGTIYDLNNYPATRRVLETGHPLFIRRDDPVADEAELALMEAQDIRGILMLPLISRDRVLGLMELLDYTKAHEYTPEQVRLAQSLAAQAAIAVENAGLFEETERLKAFNESIVQGMNEGIVVGDVNGAFTYVNPAMTAILGYSPRELLGRHWTTIIPPDQQTVIQVANERRKRGEADRYELQIIHRDGTRVPVLVSSSPRFEEGRFAGTLTVVTDITARKRMEETLRTLALLDDLTGLYNRRGFFTLGQQQLKVANRAKRRVMLLFADFDGLKRINDTFGHPEGDQVLIEVANVLTKRFRESDIVARIGGDEFVVLGIETDEVNSDVLAARLHDNLEALNAEGNRGYRLSLSVGAAYYEPESPCTLDELLTQADRAMYGQKRYDNDLA